MPQEDVLKIPGAVPTEPTQWAAIPIPAPNSEARRIAQFSDVDWDVSPVGKGLQVRLQTQSNRLLPTDPGAFTVPLAVLGGRIAEAPKVAPGKTLLSPSHGRGMAAVPVPGGFLYAPNHGEWGGIVWAISSDGRQVEKVSTDQVVQFLPTSGGLYAVQGLAHMGMRVGSLVRFQAHADERSTALRKWGSQTVATLPDAPYAAMILPERDFLVVTSSRLLRVSPAGKITTLMQDVPWEFLYPNSVARAESGDIYVGMRYAVAHIRMIGSSPKAEWLVPNRAYPDWKHHRSRLL